MPIPRIGFGTAKLGDNTEAIVFRAIQLGYRHFDCAEYYGNEEEVGRAIKKALLERIVARHELFITSKVWTTSIANNTVEESFHASLAKLNLEYIDLYLIHWPVPSGYHVEAWRTLVRLRDAGLVKTIGVSNYTIEDIKELMEADLELPFCNQMEVSPFLYRKDTIAYMQSLNIIVVAYRILSKGEVDNSSDSPVMKVAQKHGISPAQAIISWCLNNRIYVVIASKNEERMKSNLKSVEWLLEEDDMEAINNLTTQEKLERFEKVYRICTVKDTDITNPRDHFTVS